MKVGFIGTGNMGGALARAAAKSDTVSRILLANHTPEKAEALASDINADGGCAEAVSGNDIAARDADYIFLGVKPQMMEDMLGGISSVLKERAENGSRFVLVTMAAGLSIARIQEMAGGRYPVIRIMPNTPVSIGEGVVLYAPDVSVSADETEALTEMLSGAGLLVKLPEKLIDAGSAVSGCGPAYVYMFIEAMADGGVQAGLPRRDAVMLAAKTLAGSADLVLNSGRHPGELKDAVCSPGGTTIEGVRTLEECGFRGAVMDAVIAAYEKNAAFK